MLFDPAASAVDGCVTMHVVLALLGWDVDQVLAMEQSQKVFVDYIKDVVSMYDDTKQDHCENAQCIIAMKRALFIVMLSSRISSWTLTMRQ